MLIIFGGSEVSTYVSGCVTCDVLLKTPETITTRYCCLLRFIIGMVVTKQFISFVTFLTQFGLIFKLILTLDDSQVM